MVPNEVFTMCLFYRTLLVWDIRQPVQKTTSQQSTVARDQKNTYGFLDLTWKPFIRVSHWNGMGVGAKLRGDA